MSAAGRRCTVNISWADGHCKSRKADQLWSGFYSEPKELGSDAVQTPKVADLKPEAGLPSKVLKGIASAGVIIKVIGDLQPGDHYTIISDKGEVITSSKVPEAKK